MYICRYVNVFNSTNKESINPIKTESRMDESLAIIVKNACTELETSMQTIESKVKHLCIHTCKHSYIYIHT